MKFRILLVSVLASTLVLVGFSRGLEGSKDPALAKGSSESRVKSGDAQPHIKWIRLKPGKMGVRPATVRKLKVRVRNSGKSPARNVVVRISSKGAAAHKKKVTFDRIAPKSVGEKFLKIGIKGWASGVIRVKVRVRDKTDVARLRLTESGPCANPRVRARLLCPDLKVAAPHDMFVDSGSSGGQVLLRSTNDLQSRGAGPIELRGHRDRPRSMAVLQAIKRKGGGYMFFPSQMRLRFHNVGYQFGGRYWKAASPLRFELWRLDGQGRKSRLVRVGPKQFYCLRDLERTNPGPRSPASVVYPACNQNPRTRRVTLGTSVGWSDIYPATYDDQWINVTGLRGCFAYVLRVDPFDRLYELSETNNVSQRVVRLPFNGSAAGC